MPIHVHGLIIICGEQTETTVSQQGRVENPPLREETRHSLPEIIRGFKTYSSRRINALRHNHGCPVWQRNFYDRIIRNEKEMSRARAYIVNNPSKWADDRENPIYSV